MVEWWLDAIICHPFGETGLIIGPVFTREVVISPRRPRTYVARVAYVGALLALMLTAFLVLAGTQVVRDVGDLARFGMILFRILAPLQLAMAVFFSAMLAASAVAQEKDRRTLILLLLTNLTNSELVLGKLLASLLNVLVLLAASLPVFMLTALFGGISFAQIARVFAVTLAGVLVCGSLGSLIALWREKTFQALAVTVLVLVLWLFFWEMVARGVLGETWLGLGTATWAIGASPWQAILEATRQFPEIDPALGPLGNPVNLFLCVSVAIAAVLNGVAVAMVRVWNPSREAALVRREDETWHRESIWGPEYDVTQPSAMGIEQSPTQADETASAPPQPATAADRPPAAAAKAAARPRGRTRHVWDNPVIWREIRTWAYGRRTLIIRLAYLVLFGFAAAGVVWPTISGETVGAATAALALVPLLLISLVLVNAQSVTSLTSERDVGALDLLLVTDLTPKEIVFGKLGGAFYNTKEMVLLPMLLCVYMWYAGALGFENLIYLLLGSLVLYVFVAMLGIHAGMNYSNSRNAVGVSLGTVFFLFIGVATCMRIMVAFSGSFEAQLPPFLVLMLGGGTALYVALGARNPSPAIGLAAFGCPVATFYAITSFFLDPPRPHLIFVATVVAYGFTTIAMLIPALDEFDVATGRTTIGEQ